MKLKVGEKEFIIKVADTEEKRRQGLLGVKSMPKGHGLVLKYESPSNAPITMKGMKIPLGIVHIFDGKVQNVVAAQPDQEDISIGQYSDSVLEVNVEDVNGIKEGNKIEWLGKKQSGGKINFVPGEEEPVEGDLHVLNDKGQVQQNVKGSERVFSRKDTRNLLSKAQKANETEKDTDYISLGRVFVKIINKQDTQEQEYVEE